MESRMDEFRAFVSRYPKIRDEVRGGKRTWQNIYEEWVLYGEADAQWLQFRKDNNEQNTPTAEKNNTNNSKEGNNNITLNMDTLKNVYGYIKKINPDSLNKTLNTVQKVIQITQTVSSKGTKIPSFITGPYNDWWD